jgi:hypothetical protein
MNSAGKTSSSPLAVIVGALAVGWCFWLQQQNRSLRSGLHELREALAQLPAAAATTEPTADLPAAAPSPTEELIALRGEVAALRRELVERRPPAVPGAPTISEKAPLPSYVRHGWVDVDGLPAAVLDTFRQQLGEAPLKGAHVKQSEGRFFYSSEAKLADGRHMELAMDSDGKVVRRSLEMPLESLEPPVQQAVLAALGNSTDPNRINEVFDDGRTVYRVTAKNPDQAIIHVFTPEGQLLRSEVIRREDKP